MKLTEDYDKALQDLYDHVGFVEDWVVYAVEDRTEMLWRVTGDFESDSLGVRFAETMDKFNSNNDYYQDAVYTQRFYSKWVYRGEELTMIIVATGVDGNKFFAFYSNDKEVK